jgi:hypothetical protein
MAGLRGGSRVRGALPPGSRCHPQVSLGVSAATLHSRTLRRCCGRRRRRHRASALATTAPGRASRPRRCHRANLQVGTHPSSAADGRGAGLRCNSVASTRPANRRIRGGAACPGVAGLPAGDLPGAERRRCNRTPSSSSLGTDVARRLSHCWTHVPLTHHAVQQSAFVRQTPPRG